MRRRHFEPGVPYRIRGFSGLVASAGFEAYVGRTVYFGFPTEGYQDLGGYVYWGAHGKRAPVLVVGRAGIQPLNLPPGTRITKLKRKAVCTCAAYAFPHNRGKGKCEQS